MIFYIADTHFGDERIMKLCGRPFSAVQNMDEALVAQWNGTVKPEDTVYHLGDVALDDETAGRILSRLKGHKHLLLGNHDTVLKNALRFFESVSQIQTISDDGRIVCLCHYPLLSYENSICGGYHIFGHIHNNPADPAAEITNNIPTIFNAGVDVCGFQPMTLDELKEKKS